MPRGRPRAPILTVLEGKWFSRKNVSLESLFSPLFSVWAPEGGATHHYEMFTTDDAFRDAMLHAFGGGRATTVYVAAHGSRYSIQGFHDQGISRAKVRNALRYVKASHTKRGIYFGSCGFATHRNAEFILEGCTRVSWMAGYSSSVDWVDSSLLDLFFLRHFLFPSPGHGHRRPRTVMQRLNYAVERTCTQMNQLALDMEFHVYVRRHGRGGGIRDLVLER